MCEYCGCQQIPVLGDLTREHEAVIGQFALIRHQLGTGELAAAADTSRRIAALLGPHTAVEEEGLFPLMADEFPDHIEALQQEHRQIHAVLAESRDLVPGDPCWPGRLLETLVLLREHILKEQDGVFPASLSVVDGDGWAHVDEIRARVSSALPLERDHQHGHSHARYEQH
jgi:hemerythrin-like domain-containing protein